MKIADYNEYLERLHYAKEAGDILTKNPSAKWPDILDAIGWYLGNGPSEVKKLKRAYQDLKSEDDETLRDLEEYRKKKT